ncbi:MAG: hypothetical protein FJY73_03175 [Candidatus Eisenbacteria bacterium]|nr:hypothetical protein [Candidatus Eisenbacteria bacterium]
MKRTAWGFSLVLAPIVVLVPLLMLGFGCGGGDDDNPGGPNGGGVPAAWVGLWSQSGTMKDCETQTVLFTVTDTSAICPNEEDYEGIEDSVGVECDYSWSGNQRTVHCTFYDTIPGPCYMETEISYTGTVSGTSYALQGTVETSFTGECSIEEDGCMEFEISGQRIGDAPDPCNPFGDGWGGNGGGSGREGISVDITGAGSPVAYQAPDAMCWVAYDDATDYYLINSTMSVGDMAYSLNFGVPAADGPDFDLSTSEVAGKVQVVFTKTGTGSMAVLRDVLQGSFVVTAYDSEAISGTFSFSGTVEGTLGGGAPATYSFQNGTFDLSVDVASKRGKAEPLPSPEWILAHVRRTVF